MEPIRRIYDLLAKCIETVEINICIDSKQWSEMSFLQYVVQVMAKLVNIVFYIYYMYQVLPKNLCNYKRMLSIVMQIVNRSLFQGTLFNHFCCFYIMHIPVCWSSLFKINSHNFFDKWFWMGPNVQRNCLIIH